jgi:GTP cyclohydrolase I
VNAPERFFLPDMQASPDHRQLAIQQVGVKGLRYPLTLLDAAGGAHPTVATLAMTVGLPPEVKGTHMSRFVELLERPRAALALGDLRRMFGEMLLHLQAGSGRIEMRFPYFIRKTAPVSGVESLLDYQVRLRAQRVEHGDVVVTMTVAAPVTSLCPCSKEISDYGAHNQRSLVTITAELAQRHRMRSCAFRRAEASCEVFGLLKRPDEKWVTERAYDNPKFVEDLVRDVALRLKTDERIAAYVIESENFESIHNHSAYALIRHDKRGEPAFRRS